MFGSVIIDVAIGMVYIYLLLSLVASVINEALASLVQSRAANLQRGLRSLLSGDSIESGALTLVDNVYNHGLIRGLYQDPAKDLQDPSAPGWLSSVRLALQKLVGIAPAKQIEGVSNPLLLPSYIPARAFALAMIDILNKDKFNNQTPIQNIENFLSAHHQQFQKNKAVEALLTLLIDAKNDAKEDYQKLQEFQTNLENWYNDAMDRVAGWYKRYTQNILLMVGLVLAITFNVSSIRVAQTLWVDRNARQEMVDAATNYMKDHPNPPAASAGGQAQKPVQLANQSTMPAPSPGPAAADNGQATNSNSAQNQGQSDASSQPQPNPPAAATANDKSYSAQDLLNRMTSSVEAVNNVSKKLLLPLGWQHSRADYWTWWTKDTLGMAGKSVPVFIGWLITAGALSLGASFWFDMLNKIMVIRNTVKPQEKSQIEQSKDN